MLFKVLNQKQKLYKSVTVPHVHGLEHLKGQEQN